MQQNSVNVILCLLTLSGMLTGCEDKDVTKQGRNFTGPGFSQVEGLDYAKFLTLPPFRARVESVTVQQDPAKGRPYLFVVVIKQNGDKVGLAELSPSTNLCKSVSKLNIGESYVFPDTVGTLGIPRPKVKH